MRIVRHRSIRAAFSLLEVTISLVLIATMTTTATSVLLYSHVAANRIEQVRLANLLTNDLAVELASLAFADPQTPTNVGPEADEIRDDRTLLDDIDDYHGLSEQPIKTRSGVQVECPVTWRRTVAVEPCDISPPHLPVSGATILRRARIQVWDGGRVLAAVDLYRVSH